MGEHIQYDTWSLARVAFVIFWRAMRFAGEKQMSVLLDYEGGILWDMM